MFVEHQSTSENKDTVRRGYTRALLTVFAPTEFTVTIVILLENIMREILPNKKLPHFTAEALMI